MFREEYIRVIKIETCKQGFSKSKLFKYSCSSYTYKSQIMAESKIQRKVLKKILKNVLAYLLNDY